MSYDSATFSGNGKRRTVPIEAYGVVNLFAAMIFLLQALDERIDSPNLYIGICAAAHFAVFGAYYIREGERVREIDSYRLALKCVLRLYKYVFATFLLLLSLIVIIKKALNLPP